MYSRKLSNLLVAVGSKLLYKHDAAGIKVISGSLLSSPFAGATAKNIPNISSSLSKSFCSLIRPPNKDQVAKENLEEFVKVPENKKLFDILQLEVDVMRQNGENVPDKMRPRDWYELVMLNSRSKRRRYLDFIFGLEKKKERQDEEKRVRREELEQILVNREQNESDIPDYLQYKLGFNTPFLRLYDSTINRFYNWRVAKASMFSQKLIIDCGYENDMTRSEVKNCAKQLQLSFAANRCHKDPYDLHYCNLNTNGALHSDFYAFIPTMYDPSFPINVTSNTYLNNFKKDKLIYLSPDAKVEMQEYDHEAVYIVGAIVDKISGKPLSLAKAKREGIRMVKLPIDTYLHFGAGGGKSLTINQMVDILLDIRLTNDWKYALRHVPSRKLFVNRQKSMENKVNKFLLKNQEQANAYAPPRDFTIGARKKFQIKK